MKLSGLFTLGVKDFIKGLIMAIIGAIAAVVQTSIEAGNLNFDWKYMGKLALITGLSYLLKNFVTNNKDQILTKDVPKP